MKKVIVNDLMQQDYSYNLVAPAGKNFDPLFKPDLNPQEMLTLGVFGGKYMTDCRAEFPKTWFAKAALNHSKHDATLNYFGINASQPLSVWRKNGWLYKDDPRGWFQWYCRYYMGRRIVDEDMRQIRRHRAMVRHVTQIRNNCRAGDVSCRRKQRQALLHWGYDSRKL
jgi:hypothetical protein